ncbi:MAG: hypothetical protein O2783_02835 [Chloroflexi bacterium]|nr:hypothetical protein [Chloroflexota bacterium]
MADDAFNALGVILREPIEVEHLNGRFSHLPFPSQRKLFYPESFLGNAIPAIQYISGLWQRQVHLHSFWESEDEHHLNAGKFLMVVALMDARKEDGYPLYPGYRLMPPATRAMNSLCGKLASDNSYHENIAKSMDESATSVHQNWTKWVARANSAELGSGFFSGDGVHFPDPMDSRAEEW